MNDSEYRELVETSWRRPLNDDEQARLRNWLAAHSEAHTEWEAESTLNQTLSRLPDVRVSSNFTALVMQAVDRETVSAAREISFLDRIRTKFRHHSPRVAWALILVGAVWLGVRQHEKAVRHELAQGLAALVTVAAQPDPATLQDMGAIQYLSQLPAQGDDELFKVLNQ